MFSKPKFAVIALFVLTVVLGFAHYPLVRGTPFETDPNDAVWGFAFLSILLALGGSLWALRRYRDDARSAQLYSLRSQQAFAVAVIITLSADIVDLARHPSMWISAHWRNQVLGSLAVFAAIALTSELLILTAKASSSLFRGRASRRAILAYLLALASLIFCPEYGFDLDSQTAHILTVILGALVVLVPMHYLLPALVPSPSVEEGSSKAFFNTKSEQKALLIGILLGIFVFWVDAHRTGALEHLAPILKLAGPLMAILFAYGFLGEQLGLASQK